MEGIKTDLSERHNPTTPKERRRILQQRLNLLLHSSHQSPSQLFLLLALDGFHNRIHCRIHFCEPRVHEERDASSSEGAGGGFVAFGPESGVGEGVGEEGGDGGGFGDYLIF